VFGGRSTYGECVGVLTWVIDEGAAAGLSLAGRRVAMATRYHDDEAGSPWSYVLYLDVDADDRQRGVLARIFSGALAGDALLHFPWAWKPSVQLAVRPAAIDVSHEPRRQWLRIRDHVSVRVRGAWPGEETVSCVIPGHEQRGEELVVDELRVDDGPLRFDWSGNCGYAAPFDYVG
jgi:hypothetical protein